MRLRILIALTVLSLTVVSAQEKFTLTTPAAPPPATELVLRFVTLNWETQTVTIGWTDNTGTDFSDQYTATTTPTGRTLMVALNKANLSLPGQSLQARIWNRLRLNGHIPLGGITGAPE